MNFQPTEGRRRRRSTLTTRMQSEVNVRKKVSQFFTAGMTGGELNGQRRSEELLRLGLTHAEYTAEVVHSSSVREHQKPAASAKLCDTMTRGVRVPPLLSPTNTLRYDGTQKDLRKVYPSFNEQTCSPSHNSGKATPFVKSSGTGTLGRGGVGTVARALHVSTQSCRSNGPPASVQSRPRRSGTERIGP